MTAKSILFMYRAVIATVATAIIAPRLVSNASMYSVVETLLLFSLFCPPNAKIIMPTNETKIALMSILEMASFRKMWDIMATAKGDVAIITVPIDRGRILNE